MNIKLFIKPKKYKLELHKTKCSVHQIIYIFGLKFNFVHQKSRKWTQFLSTKSPFKFVFLCWNQKGYFVEWTVCIKAFWHIKINLSHKYTSTIFKINVFDYIITFWICVLVLKIIRLYCIQELVWTVSIKAFWYTKLI